MKDVKYKYRRVKKHICCSSTVLWDSNINCRLEETHKVIFKATGEIKWKRLGGQLIVCTGNSTQTP